MTYEVINVRGVTIGVYPDYSTAHEALHKRGGACMAKGSIVLAWRSNASTQQKHSIEQLLRARLEAEAPAPAPVAIEPEAQPEPVIEPEPVPDPVRELAPDPESEPVFEEEPMPTRSHQAEPSVRRRGSHSDAPCKTDSCKKVVGKVQANTPKDLIAFCGVCRKRLRARRLHKAQKVAAKKARQAQVKPHPVVRQVMASALMDQAMTAWRRVVAVWKST